MKLKIGQKFYTADGIPHIVLNVEGDKITASGSFGELRSLKHFHQPMLFVLSKMLATDFSTNAVSARYSTSGNRNLHSAFRMWCIGNIKGAGQKPKFERGIKNVCNHHYLHRRFFSFGVRFFA